MYQERRLARNWLDLETDDFGGDAGAIGALLRKRGVPENFIESALGAGSLPRFDTEGECTFFLFRVFDEHAESRETAKLALTRKLSIFVFPDEAITLHRFACPSMAPAGLSASDRKDPKEIFEYVLDWALKTYTGSLSDNEERFDALEAAAFELRENEAFRLPDAYFLKRRLATQKRTLEQIRDALEAAETKLAKPSALRRVRRVIGATETLLEGMTQLLQLHLALVSQRTNEASQRTNEVMRVLTVFSAFFLPLSFVAGVYGMNFENMPELHHRNGYFATLGLMAAIAGVIFAWFRKRGWIGGADREGGSSRTH